MTVPGMIPMKWSVSALSQHLDVDRRRLTSALKDVVPCGKKGSANLYWLADAVRAVFAPTEMDVQQETAKLRKAQTEKTQIQVAISRGELIQAETVEEVWAGMAMAYRAKVLGIPSSVAPQVVGISVPEAEALLKTHVEQAMAELKDYDPTSYKPSGKDSAEGFGDDGAASPVKRKRVGRSRKGAVKRGKRGAGKVADS